jgi:hypothetical protein
MQVWLAVAVHPSRCGQLTSDGLNTQVKACHESANAPFDHDEHAKAETDVHHAVRWQVFGPDHSDTSASATNLANAHSRHMSNCADVEARQQVQAMSHQ